MEEENVQIRTLYVARISFGFVGKVKRLPDKQKLKDMSTIKSSLKEMLNALLLFSYSIMSNSLQPHGLQHARLPCLSPTPGTCANSCQWNWWCHPTISSSVIPFSSCIQSFPASGSFLMNQLFSPSGQSIGASASASVLPMNIQDWFPLGWTVWISLLSRDSQESSPIPQFKNIKSLALNCHYGSNLTFIHD